MSNILSKPELACRQGEPEGGLAACGLHPDWENMKAQVLSRVAPHALPDLEYLIFSLEEDYCDGAARQGGGMRAAHVRQEIEAILAFAAEHEKPSS